MVSFVKTNVLKISISLRYGLFILLCLLSASVNASDRIALLIGNSDYSNAQLKNPANDARALAKTLKEVGFEVNLLTNATQVEMEDAIRNFGQKLRTGTVGLFFYAGHGAQLKGQNYLLPIKADLHHEKDLRYKTVNAGQVLDEMAYANNGLNIVILDACRNNPLTRSFRSSSRGLAKMSQVPTGTLLAYSTAPGSLAADGNGSNSPYTLALIDAINKHNLPLEMVFKEVTKQVQKKTAKKQVPWMSSSVTGDFYFSPKGKLSLSAQNKALTPTQEHESKKTDNEILNSRFVKISAGCFIMGSPADESGRQRDENSQQVCIKKDFYMGKHEVTQHQWQQIMNTNPSFFKNCGPTCPVENISLTQINEFIDKLAQNSGLHYRLPTEAEWEFACRGRISEQRYCGGNTINNLAWYSSNSKGSTHTVGSLSSNALGLFDMSGNVWEWTCSAYSIEYNGTEQICHKTADTYSLRGGSWYKFPAWQRAANRKWGHPKEKNNRIGFRLVIENPDDKE